jgi:hypothetical protein
MLNIALQGWKHPVDLSIIVDTIAGRRDWSQPTTPTLADQLPPGTHWREAVPQALEWLASTSDAESLLHQMQLKRSRSLFPRRRRQG